MKPFPDLGAGSLADVQRVMLEIIQDRVQDVKDFDNLKNVFISGRKVGKIPTGAADITTSDRIGDFNYDPDFIYIVVNNSGTAEWRRAALSSW